MSDPFNLHRFVAAQNDVYARVCAELRRGHKASHWMWFVFPQIEGLGFSSMAERYAIASIEEARAYLAHPVLGPRLRECTQLVCDVSGKTAHDIFGSPDDMKFRSCMTLFAHAAEEESVFREALQKFFAGNEDPLTLQKI